jgi:hypothetical protein
MDRIEIITLDSRGSGRGVGLETALQPDWVYLPGTTLSQVRPSAAETGAVLHPRNLLALQMA